MAAHSSIPAWRILWTEEPGGLLSIGLQSRTRLKWLSMHACIGEGNGNPFQSSCLGNPRDRGAWWAAVYGVAQSQTQLKWLSSSSSEEAKLLSSNQKVLYLWQIFVPAIFQVKCWWKIKRTVCYICASIYYTLLTGPLELSASKKGLSLCCGRLHLAVMSF